MRAMDRVFNKRVTDRMGAHILRQGERCLTHCLVSAAVNYQVMYTNIFWPIGVQIMTYMMGEAPSTSVASVTTAVSSVAGYVCFKRYRVGDTRYDWRYSTPISTHTEITPTTHTRAHEHGHGHEQGDPPLFIAASRFFLPGAEIASAAGAVPIYQVLRHSIQWTSFHCI